uniref:Myeloid leukemia factor 1 n=1 Tax=Leptobrachium leishanense TaxID=445787 RepID=A0A8C5W6D9_9ANUR
MKMAELSSNIMQFLVKPKYSQYIYIYIYQVWGYNILMAGKCVCVLPGPVQLWNYPHITQAGRLLLSVAKATGEASRWRRSPTNRSGGCLSLDSESDYSERCGLSVSTLCGDAEAERASVWVRQHSTGTMFGSLLRDFEEDPFFSSSLKEPQVASFTIGIFSGVVFLHLIVLRSSSWRNRDPFTAHQEHVRQMMRSFSDPFGRDPFFSITDGRTPGHQGRQGSQVALREDHRTSDARDSFFSVDSMMSNMRNRMIDMHRHFEGLSERPDIHSFSSSSVMSYSKTGDEPPKIFQATSQMRKAPGGIKETKKAVRDSESGVQKMAIGHHIKDRGHVVQQSNNNKTGDRELNQEFINLDESEALSFGDEWQRQTSQFKPTGGIQYIEAPKRKSSHFNTKIGPPDVPRRERCISKMVI